jgi:hypothetical protein
VDSETEPRVGSSSSGLGWDSLVLATRPAGPSPWVWQLGSSSSLTSHAAGPHRCSSVAIGAPALFAWSNFHLTASALHALFPLRAASPPRTAAGAPHGIGRRSLEMGAYATESCTLTDPALKLGGTNPRASMMAAGLGVWMESG